MLNVSEFDNATEASEALISTMQAFQYTADESQHVVDILNEVGNNYAVSSDGIATALQDSASALMEGGNNLEQATALVAAANKVVQDPSSVGSALRTISLRLRGTSVEILEQMGEETDNVAESTSKLQEKLKALTGVDILTDAGAYKDTYTILKEIGEVWQDIDPMDQAAALELMAGKNRANTLAAILNNMEDLKGAYNDALGAEGSALKENAAYLDSIQGRIDLFNNSVQTMWMNFIDDDVVKFIVDLGTAAIKLADALGLVPVAIGGFSAFKSATKDVKSNLDMINKSIQESIESKTAQTVASKANAAAIAEETAAENAGTVAKTVGTAASWKDVVATSAQTMATKALAVAKGLLTGIIKGVAMMAAAKLVSKGLEVAYKGIDSVIHRAKNLKTEVDELKDTYKSAKETLDDNLSTLTTSGDSNLYATLEDEFARLATGVDQYGNNISLTSDQYERYKSICEQIVGINPSLAAGYDSAAQAIGNNASVLSELIELQKEQARLSAQEYVSNENLSKIAENAKNDYIATKQSEDTKINNSTSELYGVLHQMFREENPSETGYNFNSDDSGSDKDDFMEYILNKLGVEDTLPIIESYYSQALGDYDIDSFIADYYDLIGNSTTKFGAQYQQTLNDTIGNVAETISSGTEDIEEANNGLVDIFLQVPRSLEKYDELNDASKKFVTEWIKNSSQFKVDNNLTEEAAEASRDLIKDMIATLSNESKKVEFEGKQITGQDLLNQYYNFDTSTVNWEEYKTKIQSFLDAIAKLTGKDIGEIKIAFGINFEEDEEKINQANNQVAGHIDMTTEQIQSRLDSMSAKQIKAYYSIDWNEVEWGNITSWSDVIDLVNKQTQIDNVVPVKTYSELTSSVESYNEILSQTSEIILDNTEVTQEYKDSLIALGISEEELADCFDDTNPLIVKNASALNKLVKSSKNNIVQNAKLAKSQARLQYYELYKQIRQLVNGQQVTNKATLNQVNSLYAEMNALEKTISRYAMLETELLGVANAYEKFELAQEADSATDYIGSTESMILALGEAFNTAELGTETAQAAIAGLVPESVYEDLDTVDEKMAAIYDYFKNGKIAQYFDLEFDEDGNITAAEMKLGNLRKFIEDGLLDTGANVFDGSDWQHFEFSDEFLAQLDELPEGADKLQFFADKMGITKEVAFAFIKSLKDHDIEWLNGDYSNMFENLLPENLEMDIYENISALADLEVQLANGEITADEYAKKLAELSEISNQNAQKARENATSWVEASNEVDAAKTEVERLTKELIALKESGASENEIQVKTDELGAASQVLSEALQKKYNLEEPTEVTIKLALDDINSKMEQWRAKNSELNVSVVPKLQQDKNGQWTIPADVEATLDEKEKIKIQEYLGLLNDQYTIQVLADNDSTDSTKELEAVKTAAEAAQKAIDNIKNPSIDTTEARTALNNLAEQINSLPSAVVKISTIVTESAVPNSSNAPKSSAVGSNSSSRQNMIYVNGTAHANGNWGLPNNEHNSLVGELGPEMIVNPYTGRYYTVGDNGAEMVDLPKGAIIFNHKQTEGLLKNGYITSRGRAYAEGNAHVTIWPQGSSKTQWEGTGYSRWDDPTYDLSDALSDAADSISDAADEFEEVFDWIEVRLEEIEEQLSLLNANLENAVGYESKNAIIDSMIAVNGSKLNNLQAGAIEYAEYASKLLTKIPAQYQKAAQNGAIAITEFAGKADEATVEAINNYREWAQKVADLKQQLEEVKTEIQDLAKQKFDNVSDEYDNIISLIESANEKLDAQVSLMEDSGYVASKKYYEYMVENTKKQNEELEKEKVALQSVLDEQVKLGNIKVGSEAWYEMVGALYEVDLSIMECSSELESFQNAINDIYWDNFDQLINRLDYLKDETQGLIDLMDSDDMVADPQKRKYENGTVEYWTADDVAWTDEGLASLGLYAQQMEIAEYKSRQYAQAIDDLTKDFNDGKYSENEYLEKLNELTNAQYDSIESYYEAQDAIKDLNETRIDSIKNGIEKEIEAYEELIEKQKEELNAEKDLHDFQKSIAEQEKNISDIKRKLAAIENDNSISAAAQRKKLQAELAEAEYELEEMYYDRSVEDKNTALDKELESFQEEKNAEITKWEEYLDNVETVVADSLTLIQANASSIYDTLNAKANEYDLTLSDAILTPWQDGALAVSDYQETFDTAASSTMDQLEGIRLKWQEIIDTMNEAAKADIAANNKANASYVSAKNPAATTKPSTTTTNKPTSSQQAPSSSSGPAVGSSVTVKGSATHFSGNSGGVKMASFVPGGSYEVYQVSGSQVLIGRGGVYTGWVNKSDLVGYAKGTTGVKENQFAWIDELGEELIIRPQNGRMAFLEKGTGVVPADLTANLMEWGKLDPSIMLEQNRPVISAPQVVNNETVINLEYGDILHIDNFSGDKPEDLSKMIDKAFDKHMKELNAHIRRYAK